MLTPTNPLYVERELERQLVDSWAETAIILDQLYPRLAQVRANTPINRVVAAGGRCCINRFGVTACLRSVRVPA